jgi:hypothetical protein
MKIGDRVKFKVGDSPYWKFSGKEATVVAVNSEGFMLRTDDLYTMIAHEDELNNLTDQELDKSAQDTDNG